MRDYATLTEFINDLKIPGFGEKRAENLASKIKNINTLRYHIEMGTIDKVLLDTKDIVEATKNEAIKKLKDVDTILLIDDLESENSSLFNDTKFYEIGELIENKDLLQPLKKEADTKEMASTLDTIKGKYFVITGTLSRTRTDFEGMIFSKGGRVSSSVSAKTDYLLVGKSDGIGTTKWKRAKALGTKMIAEPEFIEMYKRT
jgi:DNA ligase (NAD+)